MKGKIEADVMITRGLIVVISFLLLAMAGCYEPIEGCLNAQATNFDFEADNPCGECCEYPVLSLDFRHKYDKGDRVDNLVFSDSVYYDVNGHPFRLNSIKFFLSDLHLVRSDGTEVGVKDQVELGIWTANLDTMRVMVEDNFTLVDPEVFGSNELGVIRTSGSFDKLRFKIGLSEPANSTIVDAFPDELLDHPLAQEDMYLNFSEGYIYNRIELLRDTTQGTLPTVLEISGTQNLVNVELPIDFEAYEGYNIQVSLTIDYNRWFENLDVKDGSISTLSEQIVNNVADSFSLFDIDR